MRRNRKFPAAAEPRRSDGGNKEAGKEEEAVKESKTTVLDDSEAADVG